MKYHPRSQWGEGILGEEVRWAKARRLGGTCTLEDPDMVSVTAACRVEAGVWLMTS